MKMPKFKSEEDTKKHLINILKNLIRNIEQSNSYKEKAEIIKNFDLSKFNAEEQILNGKFVKDYVGYKNAKSLIYDFFKWVEQNKNIDIFNASTKDNFFNAMSGDKTLMIAGIIQILHLFPIQMQAYFILNIFRTIYELNFRNMTLILNESRVKQNNSPLNSYSLKNFKNEFNSYPKLNDLMNYFKNDIRNPIAHEDWFIKNELIWTKNKGLEKGYSLQELSKQIYELFYFRVALTTYLLKQYNVLVKDKEISEKQISKFIDSIKLKLKELEND